MMLKAKGILSFVSFSKNVVVQWLVFVWNVDDASWSHLKTCFRDVQWGALAWFWKHDLDVFSVKFCVVVSQFWSFKVFVQEVANFLLGNWQEAQKILITMIVGWDVQWGSVAVEKVFEIGSNVVHAVNNCGWELDRGGFNCDFSVVEDTVVSCGKSTVLVWWVNEMNLDVSWKSTGLALGFVYGLIIFWQNDKELKKLLVNAANFGSCQEIVNTWNDILECELYLISVFSRSKGNNIIILTNTFLSSVTLSGFSDQFVNTKIWLKNTQMRSSLTRKMSLMGLSWRFANIGKLCKVLHIQCTLRGKYILSCCLEFCRTCRKCNQDILRCRRFYLKCDYRTKMLVV